jgi:hypothetical protein
VTVEPRSGPLTSKGKSNGLVEPCLECSGIIEYLLSSQTEDCLTNGKKQLALIIKPWSDAAPDEVHLLPYPPKCDPSTVVSEVMRFMNTSLLGNC